MILPCEPPASCGRRVRQSARQRRPHISINADSACRALYNSHVLNPRSANEVLLLAVCPELSENSRREFESKSAPTKLGPSDRNSNSTLEMHVSFPKTCGRSRVQTWNRYAYVGNNPLSNVDPYGLYCGPGSVADEHSDTGCAPAPGTWPWLAFEGWPGTGSSQSFFCMLMGGCNFGNGSSGSSGGGGATQPQPPAQKPKPQPPSSGTQPQTQQPQIDVCPATILSAVNNQFGTNFTPDDVQLQFNNGQATNLNILGTGLPAAQFNSIQTGRYPLSPLTWLIGYGPTLHVTGQTFFDPAPATFANSNIGGSTSVLFTAHVDTSFAYNPFGFLIHVFRDLMHIGGPRKPC